MCKYILALAALALVAPFSVLADEPGMKPAAEAAQPKAECTECAPIKTIECPPKADAICKDPCKTERKVVTCDDPCRRCEVRFPAGVDRTQKPTIQHLQEHGS